MFKTARTMAGVDPFVNLAVAILKQAIDDATGRRRYKTPAAQRGRVSEDARRWLQDGAGGLWAALEIDEQAARRALGLENSTPNGAK